MSGTLSRKGKTELPTEAKSGLIRNANGDVRLMTDTGDVNERMMATEIFQTMSLNSPAGMYIVQDGKFVFVNPQFTSDLSVTEDTILGGKSLSRVQSEDREAVRQNAIAMLKGERTTPYEYRVTNRAGETRWFMETVTPIQYQGRRAVLGSVIDITERKQAENLLRDILNNLPTSVYIFDGNKVQLVNPAFCQNTGYTEEELLTMDPRELVHPDDREIAEKTMIERLERRSTEPFEFRGINKDGSVQSIIMSVAPIQYRGKPALLANPLNITERKQSEEWLRESRRRFRDLVNLLPLGVYEMDENLNFTFANEYLIKSTGYSPEERDMAPPGAFDHCIPEDRERMKTNIQRIMNGEFLGGQEYTNRRGDGTTYPVVVYSTAIIKDGKPVGLRGVVVDITERKKAEETLKAQKNLIDQILATIPDAVLVVSEDNKVILANAAFHDTFGMKRNDVVGKSIRELIPEPGLSKAIPKILQDKESQIDLEFRQQLNGNDRTLIATVMKMGEKEALLMLNDVTEERQKQERLFLTDRLSSIGEMSAGVAHELNNPLTGIVSLSQLLLENNPPDELEEDITDIHNEAQRAASIVRNLLTFSRKHAPVREPTQLNRVIEDVLQLRNYEHKVNNIKVETQLAPDLPEVIVDYHQMQQVFLNIVLNAESAMTEAHESGTLTITTSRLNGNVVVSFSDDGPGIPQENLNRVFDPFFTTKEVGKGTGLGLSICYGIVTQHGGKIHANNKTGKGVTFVVELPVES